MKRLLASTALAALAFAVPAAAPVRAADLDYSYKDSRPAEPYAPYYYHRDQAPRGEYYEEKRHGRYDAPPPYADPPPRFSHYDERATPPRDQSRYDQRGCLTKGEIRYRLKEHGWQDFQEIDLRDATALVSARRPDGLLYRLEVDRCTGVIVQARLIDEGRGGGWRQGSRSYPTY